MGIDGGGTQTTCLVADERTVLGSATTGGSNITRLGEARARESLHAAVRAACAEAKVDPRQVKSACVGLSGAGRVEVRESVQRMLKELLPGRLLVVGDIETTMEAAFGAGPGVIAIAGTGSSAYGRDAAGRTARSGGWGLAISDEGSGQWVGRAAISSLLDAHDAGLDPALLRKVLGLWKMNSLAELVRHANASPPPDFSSLFPHVLAAADSGDEIGAAVLQRAGREVAGLVGNVIRRLFVVGNGVRVAVTGGVFRESALARGSFRERVIAEFPEAVVNVEVVDPAQGALSLARKAAGTGGG